ncbi:MAG: hypothetical protein JWM02_500 [Frankiales bacterium]|nr:hypothetical protein [Frankiales bacterium]
MYVWIWRRLPGPMPARVLQVLVLLGIAVALLFFVVFPRVEPLLPYTEVTVNQAPAATSSPG